MWLCLNLGPPLQRRGEEGNDFILLWPTYVAGMDPNFEAVGKFARSGAGLAYSWSYRVVLAFISRDFPPVAIDVGAGNPSARTRNWTGPIGEYASWKKGIDSCRPRSHVCICLTSAEV